MLDQSRRPAAPAVAMHRNCASFATAAALRLATEPTRDATVCSRSWRSQGSRRDESAWVNRVSEEPEAVEIPIDALSNDALRGVVESFVNREGTDYGAVERTLDDKVADVMRQLEDGSARLVFDSESESIQIVPVD